MPIQRARRPGATMDMTPMIDCVFQLLIFFMLSSSMVMPQIKIDLPEAQTKDHTDTPEIVLSATTKGEWYLNQEQIRFEQLPGQLRPLIERAKLKVVTFRGDKGLDYEVFLKALDISRRSGAAHMNVMHQ